MPTPPTRTAPGMKERSEEITRLWAAGADRHDIAEHFGWSLNRTSQELAILRNLGYSLPFKKRRRGPSRTGGLNVTTDGRTRIICRDGSTVLYYRAVMEAELRRPLRPDEHVHHVNGDKTDDRIENLQLIAPGDHLRLHWDEWGRKDVTPRGCEVCDDPLSRRQLLVDGRFCSQKCMGVHYRRIAAERRAAA